VKQYQQFNSGAGAVQVGCVHGNVTIFQCPYAATCGSSSQRVPTFDGGRLMKTLLILVAATALAAPAWAINKCTGPDGKVSFQDAPCEGQGARIDVRPAAGPARPASLSGNTGAKASPPPSPTAAPAAPTPPAPLAQQPRSEEPTPLQVESAACLAWYRPALRDPAGAYLTGPSKEGRVVSITVHATNGYGGYVTRPAACEFINGRLDQDWTKIHAKRAGWSVD